MTLHYSYFSGNLNTIETALKKSVAVYTSKYQRVKIGITNNPERQVKEHERNVSWKRMIVKYYIAFAQCINNMECLIITHHWDRVENEVGGGGGPNGGVKLNFSIQGFDAEKVDDFVWKVSKAKAERVRDF